MSTSTKKNVTTEGKKNNAIEGALHLSVKNYIYILVGFAVILLGYILMSGGKSDNPNVFDEKAIYSFRRITLAPITIIVGFGVIVYGIMKKEK